MVQNKSEKEGKQRTIKKLNKKRRKDNKTLSKKVKKGQGNFFDKRQ
jgi:hypothetical protein